MLAVDGVGVMQAEAAVRTFEAHLVRPEDRLEQPQEKAYPDDHDDHREDPSARPVSVMSPNPVVVSVVIVK